MRVVGCGMWALGIRELFWDHKIMYVRKPKGVKKVWEICWFVNWLSMIWSNYHYGYLGLLVS